MHCPYYKLSPNGRNPSERVLSPSAMCVYRWSWYKIFRMSATSHLLLIQDVTWGQFLHIISISVHLKTHIGSWNNIKQSWRLCQIVHNYGGKLGRGAEKGREELMLKCVWVVLMCLFHVSFLRCCQLLLNFVHLTTKMVLMILMKIHTVWEEGIYWI